MDVLPKPSGFPALIAAGMFSRCRENASWMLGGLGRQASRSGPSTRRRHVNLRQSQRGPKPL